MTTTLPAVQGGAPIRLDALTADQVSLLKRTVANGTTDDEFALFLYTAQRSGLDPFQRQIYSVKRWSTKDNREVMSIQTGIDGYRLIAQRTGEYLGQTPPEWCGSDGVWVTAWLDSAPPAAARIGVYKRGNQNPTVRVALWAEYAQWAKSRNGERYLTGLWKSMPSAQLLKCAEALALRAAFPNDLGGIHTAEEMGQADNPPPAPVIVTTAAKALPPSEPAEPVRIEWADLGPVGDSQRIVGTVTAVEQKTSGGAPIWVLTIVREDGDSAQYRTRREDIVPVAEAAAQTEALIEARFIVMGSVSRIVSLRDPTLPVEAADAD